MKTVYKITVFLLVCSMLLPPSIFAYSIETDYNRSFIYKNAVDIINWKKKELGFKTNDNLFHGEFLDFAGQTDGDWIPIAMKQLDIKDDYSAYLSALTSYVEKKYREPDKLSASKAAEWHRISLATLSCGGNPEAMGKDANGKSINLISDGTYNRGKTADIGRQGITGYIWALTVLDSANYSVPKNSFTSRKDIIIEILKRQLPDGGFALIGNIADPDITAMALQALSTYKNDKDLYEYTCLSNSIKTKKTIKTVIDELLKLLSEKQLESGDFMSWGALSSESISQTIIALCSLGINPETDKRFIKNGNTLFDALFRFRLPDGGFAHVIKENQASVSDTKAGSQALLAFSAYVSCLDKKPRLYSFIKENSNDTEATEKTAETEKNTDKYKESTVKESDKSPITKTNSSTTIESEIISVSNVDSTEIYDNQDETKKPPASFYIIVSAIAVFLAIASLIVIRNKKNK